MAVEWWYAGQGALVANRSGGSVDVAIVGGGAMGWSTAFWLTGAAPDLRVAVYEQDPGAARSATALSVASIRQQFTTEINVKISRFGIDFMSNFEMASGASSDLGLHENGYLFLAGTTGGAEVLRQAAQLQRRLGAATEVLQPPEIAARFPWLNIEGVALGSFGPKDEGWYDNMALLSGLRDAACRRGAYSVRAEVRAIAGRHGHASGVVLADGSQVSAGAVVLAAGTGTPALLQTLGEECPVEPRKRTVFVIDAPEASHPDAPLLVDHSGFYLRPEGKYWLTAIVPKEDGPCAADDFEPDLQDFDEYLWPKLYARAPEFAALKVVRAWAGHYDFNRFDQNAVVGHWPGFSNLYVLTGFSGHGLQQAPAMGRGIAELLTSGRYLSLDLTALRPERIAENTPVLEKAVV